MPVASNRRALQLRAGARIASAQAAFAQIASADFPPHPQPLEATSMKHALGCGLTALVAGACAALPCVAATTLDTRLIASGLSAPLFATAPLADGRVFVVEQGGTVKVALGGMVSTFLSLAVASGGEQGLLGLAFDPGYANPASAGYRRFFIDAIDPTTQDTVIASYRTSADASVADPASRVELLRVDQPAGRSNHKAGWLGFKPGDADHLYIATGDGGAGNDPDNNAQNRGVLLGKMLRIDVNRDDFADTNVNYGVPADNPYFNTPGARGEIYASGLRNPFRNSFDRATGNLWIGDVGQGAREEIDFIAAASAGGQNFGWRIREGSIATPGIGDADPGGLTGPLLDYDHSVGASVTGGYVVREAGSPLFGRYVFGDFISGRIWATAADGSAQTLASAEELTAQLDAGAAGPLGNISSFGEGADGALFIVDYAGKVVQVVPEPPAALLLLLGGTALLLRRARRPQPCNAEVPQRTLHNAVPGDGGLPPVGAQQAATLAQR